MQSGLETVAFGGGCFWCTEAVFLELKGVTQVTPGYAGGHDSKPTYESVSSGKTGHAEVILIEYDPSIISFEKLLDVFFTSHDPTTLNRQGADVGEQYRSTILYTSEAQKKTAQGMIERLTEAKKYKDPIITELKLLDEFYPAEAYHMRYYESHEDAPYSQIMIAPKLEKLRREHEDLLKQ